MSARSDGGLLDYKGAAAFIGVRPSTLMIWVSRGDKGIPYMKVGGKMVRFRPESLTAWLRSQERGGRPEFEGAR